MATADDLAVLGIRGHPVPEPRQERRRAGFDDRMEPLAHGAIRFRHRGDLREHGAFPVRLVRARAGRGAAFFAACLVALLADFCVPFAWASLPGAFFSDISVSILVALRRRTMKLSCRAAEAPWTSCQQVDVKVANNPPARQLQHYR